MGSLILPASGPVYADVQIVIYIERRFPRPGKKSTFDALLDDVLAP
jgi:hypothetical protein